MSNPLFEQQTNQNVDSQSIFGLMNQIRNSPDPNAAMQTLISNNPQIQNVMQYINQNGGDARTAFYNLAAQKGIDPNTILNQLR